MSELEKKFYKYLRNFISKKAIYDDNDLDKIAKDLAKIARKMFKLTPNLIKN